MQAFHIEKQQNLADTLRVERGITALVGGGGKTTLMYALASSLSERGRVIVTTTTHILPPAHLPLVSAPDPDLLAAAFALSPVILVGKPDGKGKLTAADCTPKELLSFCDYLLVEADGAKRLPLKAPADHEPVIPDGTAHVIAVVGLDGIGKPIAETVFRADRYATLLGKSVDAIVTPQDAARVLQYPNGQRKGVTEQMRYSIVLNKADTPALRSLGEAVAAELEEHQVSAVYVTSLKNKTRSQKEDPMLVLIRGAGDLASGVACRLHRAGFRIVMTDLPQPTAIRRTVCFSEAIVHGTAVLEGITARLAHDASEVGVILAQEEIAVLADAAAACIQTLHPDVVVDAILAKRNLGTSRELAPIVIALGPGFTAGEDCHAVVETMRGHTLGRVYYAGSALPNTGIPGSIGGYTLDRILRAPCAGSFRVMRQIGDTVEAGEVCAYVDETPIRSNIRGVLRGILPDGTPVYAGMKSGDVDPRCQVDHCYTCSDKALAIGGGVLEAILHLTRKDA